MHLFRDSVSNKSLEITIWWKGKDTTLIKVYIHLKYWNLFPVTKSKRDSRGSIPLAVLKAGWTPGFWCEFRSSGQGWEPWNFGLAFEGAMVDIQPWVLPIKKEALRTLVHLPYIQGFRIIVITFEHSSKECYKCSIILYYSVDFHKLLGIVLLHPCSTTTLYYILSI